MSETELRSDSLAVMARLRAAETCGQALVDGVLFHHHQVQRQSKHDVLRAIARLESDGEFTERGVVAKAAVADMLGIKPADAFKLTRLAISVFPTMSLTGESLAPKLPYTAVALTEYAIDQAHGLVIDAALNTSAAGRLTPGEWSGAEETLADWARTMSPVVLESEARQLINSLDQDGPEPGEDGSDALVNDLSLTPYRGGGGRIKGTLDPGHFEQVKRAVEAGTLPAGDECKGLTERQADALAEICGHALDEGRFPERGGERPHVTIILTERELREQARGAVLEYGGRASAAYTRMLLCDCGVIPVVLGSEGQPVDVGRIKRTATPGQRKAVAARDRACAHPGCNRPVHWCDVHHIVPWSHGGTTDINNLVLLCRQHHRMVHDSG
jgi:Domain of unknown function (DUF222)/HNH endonuclease